MNLLYIPAVLLMACFVLYPLARGIYISFFKWNGYSQNMTFIGLKNYLSLLSDKYFKSSFWNTMLYGFGSALLQNVFGLALALFLNSKFKIRNAVRTIIYLPVMISGLLMGYTWGWVPYTDPGANLTFAIRDELRRVEAETGKVPSVILMQNHGIIVHDDDPDTALAIHTDANERLARMFGLSGTSFPKIAVREMAAGIYAADVPYLAGQFRTGGYTQEFLMTQPLYPDQIVFLTDTFYLDQETLGAGQAVASGKTGELLMQMDAKKALTLTETLTAVFFVMEHICKAGYELSTMGEAAKKFIANWESEKYRKSLAGKKA